MLTVGSLFSGIGGIDLGLQMTGGFETRWFVEIDPWCRRVLAKHWPGVPCYGDIRELSGADLEPVDLVAGGFPCQPVSVAGKRRGDADERWLWPEFLRVIRLVAPRWVLVENVPGLRSADNGRLFGGILRDLAESGYDAEWDCIPASAVGAHHQRDRLWLIAYSRCSRTRLEEHRGRGQGWQPTSPLESTILRQSHGQGGSEGHHPDSPDVAYSNGIGSGTRPWLPTGGGSHLSDIDGCSWGGPTLAEVNRILSNPQRTGLEGHGTNAGQPPQSEPRHSSAPDVADADESALVGWAGELGQGRWPEPADSGWWEPEPPVCGVVDGLPRELDGLDVDRGLEALRSYADSTSSNPREVLREVRRVTSATTFQQRGTRSPDDVCSTEVLQLYLRELARRCDEEHVTQAGAQTTQGGLRGVRHDSQPTGTPRRSEPGEQHTGEHPDALQVLSRFLAQDCHQAWTPYRGAYATDRVNRLRGLGNAVVPQIVEHIGRMILRNTEPPRTP